MDKEIYRCARCHVELQGRAEFCVRCYAWVNQPCPNCTVLDANGKPKLKWSGKKLRETVCPVCGNQRRVRYEYAPLPWPK